jgi:hypothetical protein
MEAGGGLWWYAASRRCQCWRMLPVFDDAKRYGLLRQVEIAT